MELTLTLTLLAAFVLGLLAAVQAARLFSAICGISTQLALHEEAYAEILDGIHRLDAVGDEDQTLEEYIDSRVREVLRQWLESPARVEGVRDEPGATAAGAGEPGA